MKQLILIGFSTTGKSFLAERINKINNQRKVLDTDKLISIHFGGSISDIFYKYPQDRFLALDKIKMGEIIILKTLAYCENNLVIAAGPGVPLHTEFEAYIQKMNPVVVSIEKEPEEIYQSLVDRRTKMFCEKKHQRPEFGIWDVGIMVEIVDGKTIELSKEIAIQNIKKTVQERENYYNRFANIKIKSKEIFQSELPKSLQDLI